jgi:hypothetical protein
MGQQGGAASDLDSLWPYDHNELALCHGQLKPRNVSRMVATAHVEGSEGQRHTGAQRSKRDISSLPSFSSVVSTTTAQEVLLALCRHLRSVMETHGAVEFAPATLLHLRDSPAVTLAADIQFARSLLIAPFLASSNTSKGRKGTSLYELWARAVNAFGSSGTAVAEYLEPGAGLIVSLPSDLISPFARTASLLRIQSSVRYQIGRVYTSRSTSSQSVDVPEADQDLLRGAQGLVQGQGQGRTPLTPLGSGVGEHPSGCNEAVFDVVRGGKGRNKTDVECEVLSVALSCLSMFRSTLPLLAIRVTDSRLLDALLEVCLWPLLPSPSSPRITAESSTLDIEKLLRALSVCGDIEGGAVPVDSSSLDDAIVPQYLQLLNELELPQWLAKRLAPFFRLFSLQLNQFLLEGEKHPVFVGRPMQALDDLEREFYNLDTIIAMQRLLAKQGDVLDKSLVSTSTEVDMSTNQLKQKNSDSKGLKADTATKLPATQQQVELSSVLGGIGVKTSGPAGRSPGVPKGKEHRALPPKGPQGGKTIPRDKAEGARWSAAEAVGQGSGHSQEVFSREDLAR